MPVSLVLDSTADVFKRLVDASNDVVAMTVAAKLSGTYANAREAAQRFGAKVRVVDSAEVGTTIAVNIGPGAVGICAIAT